MGKKRRGRGAGREPEPSFANPPDALFAAFEKSGIEPSSYFPLAMLNRRYRNGIFKIPAMRNYLEVEKIKLKQQLAAFHEWITGLNLKAVDELSLGELKIYHRGILAMEAEDYYNYLRCEGIIRQPLITIPTDRLRGVRNPKLLYDIYHLFVHFKQYDSRTWYTAAESLIRKDDVDLFDLLVREKKIDLKSPRISVREPNLQMSVKEPSPPFNALNLTAFHNLTQIPNYLLSEKRCTVKDLAMAAVEYATAMFGPALKVALQLKAGTITLDCSELTLQAFSQLSKFFLNCHGNTHITEIVTDEVVRTLRLTHFRRQENTASFGASSFFPTVSLESRSFVDSLCDFIRGNPKLKCLEIEGEALSPDDVYRIQLATDLAEHLKFIKLPELRNALDCEVAREVPVSPERSTFYVEL